MRGRFCAGSITGNIKPVQTKFNEV